MTSPLQPRAGLSVRATRGRDWKTVRDVRLAALAESPAMFGSTLARERLFDEPTWRTRTVHTAVAWRGDAAVGIAGWRWTEPDVAADVVSMWVSPDARGTGAGARGRSGAGRSPRHDRAHRVRGVARGRQRC